MNTASIAILSGFVASTVTEAAEANTQRLAHAGRVSDLSAELFGACGLSFVAAGGKGASPKGAHAALAALVQGDAPSRALIKGIAKDWASVCQSLHSLVSMLHAAGACPAPVALPAWADMEAIAKAKVAAAAKRAANKAAKAGADTGDTEGADGAESGASTVQAAPAAPAANLIAAAIKAQAYSAAELRAIVNALVAMHVIDAATVDMSAVAIIEETEEA